MFCNIGNRVPTRQHAHSSDYGVSLFCYDNTGGYWNGPNLERCNKTENRTLIAESPKERHTYAI